MTPPLFPACTATTMRPHALRLAVHAGALWAVTTMRGKFGSEFESKISYNAPMHFRHRQTETDIVA